jgi:HEPN domain-containing protein
VARLRLDEAEFLLTNGYTTVAAYLAGYAVECALKALLLSREPASRQAAVVKSFRGTRAHDFEWLRHRLLQKGVPLPLDVALPLARVAWWTTDLRYSAKAIGLQTAKPFLEAVKRVVQFAEGRL